MREDGKEDAGGSLHGGVGGGEEVAGFAWQARKGGTVALHERGMERKRHGR